MQFHGEWDAKGWGRCGPERPGGMAGELLKMVVMALSFGAVHVSRLPTGQRVAPLQRAPGLGPPGTVH